MSDKLLMISANIALVLVFLLGIVDTFCPHKVLIYLICIAGILCGISSIVLLILEAIHG